MMPMPKAAFALGLLSGFAFAPIASAQTSIKLAPGSMPRIGSVSERYQSYNIEMVEVTGGRFWKPYASVAAAPAAPAGNQPVGMDPSLYEYRPPIDLSNVRLRKLAAALGPAYLRVSGTWANNTFFDPSAEAVPTTAPDGFKGVLTGKQWKGVLDFAKASNAEIVTSFSTSAGTRDASGTWTPIEAKKIVEFTHAHGSKIAAAELMNEPTFAEIGGAPKGYDAAAYARDFNVFRTFAKQTAPEMLILGPGGVGEGGSLGPLKMKLVPTEDILTATGPAFGAFSYHSYSGVSSRCARGGGGTTIDAALTEDWLNKGGQTEQFYASLRDRFEPGKSIWNTETAQTACGGDKWAATFIDSFRYLNQLGDLAKRGVQVHLHNTLAASDYGLLDEKTYAPRPNYWAALLWHRLMGPTVLDAAIAPTPNLHLYAHCLPGHPGGVTVLAISLSKTETQIIDIPTKSERYTLTAKELTAGEVSLNGESLTLGPNDSLPTLKGVAVQPGKLTLAPESITFLTFPTASNTSCN